MNCSDLSPSHTENPIFDVAPYIHPYNEAKYDASLKRALAFAAQRKTVCLWLFVSARDLLCCKLCGFRNDFELGLGHTLPIRLMLKECS